jgi:hypothetical protein
MVFQEAFVVGFMVSFGVGAIICSVTWLIFKYFENKNK